MGSISIPALLTDQLLTPDNLQLYSEGLQNHEVRKLLQIYSFVFEKWTHGTILREFAKAHCQPSTGLTPTPLNSGCFTGGEKPHIILLCVCSTVPQGPGLRLSSWQPSTRPSGHRASPKEMLWTSVWSPSLSWFTSSAPCSTWERNHSPTLRNVYTLSSGPFLHLSRAPAIKTALPQSFPHLPLLCSVTRGW